MGRNKNTKASHKNLYPQKSSSQLLKSTRVSFIASKREAGKRLSRSVMMSLGRRKVRKATIPMSGSFLYNTGRRNTFKSKQEKTKLREAEPLLKTTARLKGNVPLLLILQNKLMHDGRKGMAEKIFHKVMKELNHYDPEGNGFKLIYVALERLKPALTTVTRRVGRNYYSVPVPLKATQQYKMAFQWLLEAA
jgi:ribosomal protein S7